jgi:protein gp37
MTKIEWTEKTWNPLAGCSIVSAGCRNCYAMRMARRLEGRGLTKYSGTTAPSKRGPVWTGVVRFDPAALQIPLHEARPTVWFVNSMSDAFHERAPDEWRDQMYEIMAACKQHVFQVLTKRPDQAARYYSARPAVRDLPNVWLGVTVEHQDTVGRMEILRRIPVALRFVSAEPLLGPLVADWTDIHWVIIGGESGPRARPCDPSWAYRIADDADRAGTAVFHKQWGTWQSNPLVRSGMPVAEARRRDPDPAAKGGAWWPGGGARRALPR